MQGGVEHPQSATQIEMFVCKMRELMIKVVDAKYIRDYVVWIKFSDGIEGEVDLRGELFGEVFEPLKDKEFFKKFVVHPEWLTIAWPNGADFAPEFLHSAVQVHA